MVSPSNVGDCADLIIVKGGSTVAYAEFFNEGGVVTSHHDHVKIIHYNYSNLQGTN